MQQLYNWVQYKLQSKLFHCILFLGIDVTYMLKMDVIPHPSTPCKVGRIGVASTI